MKQHIVGSLLFTPLLLLLPTTSVFYIFFSILDTTINLICILIGVTVSVIHATPCIKIFLWLVRRRRFPSGIWFDILSCQGDSNDSSNDFSSPFENLHKEDIGGEKSSYMVSFLHSNFMTFGEISFSPFSFALERPWGICYILGDYLSIWQYLKFIAETSLNILSWPKRYS